MDAASADSGYESERNTQSPYMQYLKNVQHFYDGEIRNERGPVNETGGKPFSPERKSVRSTKELLEMRILPYSSSSKDVYIDNPMSVESPVDWNPDTDVVHQKLTPPMKNNGAFEKVIVDVSKHGVFLPNSFHAIIRRHKEAENKNNSCYFYYLAETVPDVRISAYNRVPYIISSINFSGKF
ncbi:hypothetical protein JTB14_009028 [Gonioctena quinquepunctata]|nr:hypothetical protein JTB14_009028 [Gonioctena quinquepunctata]